MPELAQSTSLKSNGSFATLLASFTRKLQNEPWDDTALADDVVTLTYEQALGSARQARFPEPATKPLLDNKARKPAESNLQPRKPQYSKGTKQQRTASITLRVTAEEQTRLHERAIAAQLSVSAYLRSCIFEAESLRTQVKEALEQMQRTQTNTEVLTRKGIPYWRKRLFSLRSRINTTKTEG